EDARAFAHTLAGAIAGAGGVVVSGGAHGIDAAAHRGAMEAGGRTLCVAATGHARLFPADHAPLYEEIVKSGGAMIWPFSPETRAWTPTFRARNRVLVSLADVVVIV